LISARKAGNSEGLEPKQKTAPTVFWLLTPPGGNFMSDKDRKKKAGENKDKENQRMREAIEDRARVNPTERQRQKHEAKLTDTVPQGEARMKKRAAGDR
jgi:hypothetical protein